MMVNLEFKLGNDDEFERLLTNYRKAKTELENYLWKTGLSAATEKVESPSGN